MSERPPRYGWASCVTAGVGLLHMALFCVALGHWQASWMSVMYGSLLVGIGVALVTIDTALWRLTAWLTR